MRQDHLDGLGYILRGSKAAQLHLGIPPLGGSPCCKLGREKPRTKARCCIVQYVLSGVSV